MKKIDIYALIWGGCIALSSAFSVLVYVTLLNSSPTIIEHTNHIHINPNQFFSVLYEISVLMYFVVVTAGAVLCIPAYFLLKEKKNDK